MKEKPRRPVSPQVVELFEQLYNFRMDMNISQQEAADRAGVARTTWSMAEQGLREPSVEIIGRMAQAVGRDMRIKLVKTKG